MKRYDDYREDIWRDPDVRKPRPSPPKRKQYGIMDEYIRIEERTTENAINTTPDHE
jgi:hypothetical protein